MAWFQMKYGLAIIYVGLLALALDHKHANQCIYPICVGVLIVAAAYLAQRLRRWHYTPLQCNTMMFIASVFWAGIDLTHNLTPASTFCGMGVLLLASMALFITNQSFQQEPEDLNELGKSNA